jgi:hypothetical protein
MSLQPNNFRMKVQLAYEITTSFITVDLRHPTHVIV